jgi:hypothetical protein
LDFFFSFCENIKKIGSEYVLLIFDQISNNFHLIFSFIGHEQGVAIAICQRI